MNHRRLVVVLLVLVAGAFATSQVAFAGGTVNVSAKEFKFRLSKSTISHGTVTFKLKNNGTLAHDFKIAGKRTAVIRPGKTATVRVRLRKGTFTYVCTVPGHANAGMKGRFKVR